MFQTFLTPASAAALNYLVAYFAAGKLSREHVLAAVAELTFQKKKKKVLRIVSE